MRTALIAFAAGLSVAPASKYGPELAPQVLALFEPQEASAAVTAKCTPLQFSVSFAEGDSDLNMADRATLDVAGQAVRGCTIETVAIEADAAEVATPEGRRLSGLRGAALLKELGTRGVAPASVVIAASENGEPASAGGATQMRLSIVPTHKRVLGAPQEARKKDGLDI
jgi:outer membrane protein OmpA-like peptidoglycan-associated protein